MIRILFSALFLCLISPAFAQVDAGYVPFPANFDTLGNAEKEAALNAIDSNSEKYFRSKEYGYALTKFMHLNNPQGIQNCEKLRMLDEHNKISIVEPLLFEKSADLHPLVGKWEQRVAFSGCDQIYRFKIDAAANKAAEPVLTLRTGE